MKPQFTILLLLVSFHAFNQNKIEFGAIRADSSFKANQRTNCVDSTNFGIGDIFDSKNELEIRLKTVALPIGGEDVIIMTYNNGTWDARKYLFERIRFCPTTCITFIKTNLTDQAVFDKYFENIFDSLRQNKIFLLPGMRELKYEGAISDGAAFILTFKVKDQFREYFYSNPGQYADENPNIAEFKQLTEF